MNPFDLDVRRHVYFSVIANGRPPTAGDAAAAFGRDVGELEECYRRQLPT